MLHRTIVVFDDFVYPGAVDAIHTDDRFNVVLGEHDHLAFEATADNPAAAATVSLYVAHSSDGRNWLYRATNDPANGAAEMTLPLSGVGAVTSGMWSAANRGVTWGPPVLTVNGPMLPLVRIHVGINNSRAHVKISFTHRGAR